VEITSFEKGTFSTHYSSRNCGEVHRHKFQDTCASFSNLYINMKILPVTNHCPDIPSSHILSGHVVA
jgi:hypothetical protein